MEREHPYLANRAPELQRSAQPLDLPVGANDRQVILSKQTGSAELERPVCCLKRVPFAKQWCQVGSLRAWYLPALPHSPALHTL